MTERQNKEKPLRVRLTDPEHDRLLAAAGKLGLTKSVYVRWALENSTTQVLGTRLDGTSVAETPAVEKPKRAPRQRSAAPAAVSVTAPIAETVPDLATAMGFSNDIKPAEFDDSDWT